MRVGERESKQGDDTNEGDLAEQHCKNHESLFPLGVEEEEEHKGELYDDS